MLALTLSFVAILYLAGLRSDRALTKPVALRGDVGTSLEEGQVVSSGLNRNSSSPGSVNVAVYYRGLTAKQWAAKFRHRTRQYQHARYAARARWQPTVDYALTLAAAVTGVSYWQLRSVSLCESHHDPYATNGKYRGLFQLGWRPFGLDPYEPIANALSAAMTVRHDGSWRQWSCKP